MHYHLNQQPHATMQAGRWGSPTNAAYCLLRRLAHLLGQLKQPQLYPQL